VKNLEKLVFSGQPQKLKVIHLHPFCRGEQGLASSLQDPSSIELQCSWLWDKIGRIYKQYDFIYLL
jgi:hypothetical protein